jgi:hypothetical protein
MFTSVESILRSCALLACATVVGMIVIFFATGVGQDPLQFVHPPQEYLQLLTANPAALRATLALDNLFVVFYATMFLALGVVLRRRGAPKTFLGAAIGLLSALALLDLVENFHFMVMLARAELGVAPSAPQIAAQVWESLLKFHVSYLGLFLLGCALPHSAPGERMLQRLSWFVQLPIGILIYVTPRAVSVPLVFVRFTYFVTALALVARLFGPRPSAIGSGAPASLPGTTPGVVG